MSSLAGRSNLSAPPLNSNGGKKDLLFGCLPIRSKPRKIRSRRLRRRGPDGVHQTLINAWKKQAVEKLSTVFESKSDAGRTREADIEKLHAKIGQLIVERDFLEKAFGR